MQFQLQSSEFKGPGFSHITTQHPRYIKSPWAALLNHFTGAKILGYICVYETLKLILQIQCWISIPIYSWNGMRDAWVKHNAKRWNKDFQVLTAVVKNPARLSVFASLRFTIMFNRQGLIGSTVFMKIMQPEAVNHIKKHDGCIEPVPDTRLHITNRKSQKAAYARLGWWTVLCNLVLLISHTQQFL